MNEYARFSHKLKSIIIAVFVITAMGSLVYRLYFLQVYQHSFFVDKAKKQHLMNLKTPAKRGKIFDRKMRELATTVASMSVYAVPQEIRDAAKTVKVLSGIIEINRNDIIPKLQTNKKFAWIKRKISVEEADKIESMDLDGIYLRPDTKRVYPGGMLLSHVLGFVGIDDEGLEGLELKYDQYLSGKPGWSIAERDGKRREVVPLRHQSVSVQDGMDLVTTIDIAIQTMVESQIDILIEKYEPESASIVVMNPANGDILALANRPTFNPNNPGQYSAEARRNRAITDIFEPGSTFKSIVMAASLNEGMLTLDEKFFCENGQYRIGSHVLHDAHSFGILTLREILEKSSNIGMAKVGAYVGEKKIHSYVRKFGFGNTTHSGLSGEVNGFVNPLKNWSKLSVSSISMGQEIAVTALQLSRAYCAIANGGYLVKPKIIREIIGQDGRVIIKDDVEERERIIKEEVARDLADALMGVVSERGTAPRAAVEGYTVAGKTGTAQKVDPQGGYSQSKFVSSFVGFLPVSDPKAVILVVVNEPKYSHYGGTVAAPYFKTVAANLMRYLEVSPDTLLAKTE
ncbi:MAG: penicillin-binding transpeptidase domain-containing protein [Chlamydiota bacterium]|nr:penicillin-binding transpeptidase domain-containing protein [Chlamydiota bacterium]